MGATAISKSSSIMWFGFVAGFVFMVIEMILLPATLGESFWTPIQMIAAIVMGEDEANQSATFNLGILMVALIIHFSLSVIYTYVLTLFISNRSTVAAISIGGIFGLALYFINLYGFTFIFPWFARARNWAGIFAHIMFGFAAGYSYNMLYKAENDQSISKKKKEAV